MIVSLKWGSLQNVTIIDYIHVYVQTSETSLIRMNTKKSSLLDTNSLPLLTTM